ncbi:MAG: glycosyltransferase family 39 protein [Lentisphaerae bacterium]|nr:glycosyltransferase family 39 protein [Lentisphaerota bacterium]
MQNASRETAPKKLLIPALLVLFLGAAVRLWYVQWNPETFQNGLGCYGDTFVYADLASNLAEHGVFSQARTTPRAPSAYKPPGYPLFLAGLMHGGIDRPREIRVVQGLADSLSALFVFGAAWALTRRVRAATVAGVLIALSPYNVHFARALLSDWLGSTLFAAFLAVLCLAAARRSLPCLLAAGVAMGATILTRPAMLLYPFLAAGALPFAWAGTWRRRLGSGLVLLLATGIVVGSWTVRNFVTLRRVIPVSAGGMAVGLVQGTWETAGNWDWATVPRDTFDSDAEHREIQRLVTRYPAVAYAGQMDELRQINAALKKAAWKRIRRDPVRYVRLCAGRFPLLWWFHSVHMYLDTHPDGRFMIPLAIGWLLSLALVRRQGGLYALLWLTPVYITLMHLPAHCESRFSLPAIPALCILAGCVTVRRRDPSAVSDR